MFRIAAKFQNIPLGDADVLQQFPGRVIRSLGLLASEPRGKTRQSSLQIDVSVPACEQFQDVTAQSVVVFHFDFLAVALASFAGSAGSSRLGVQKAGSPAIICSDT